MHMQNIMWFPIQGCHASLTCAQGGVRILGIPQCRVLTKRSEVCDIMIDSLGLGGHYSQLGACYHIGQQPTTTSPQRSSVGDRGIRGTCKIERQGHFVQPGRSAAMK